MKTLKRLTALLLTLALTAQLLPAPATALTDAAAGRKPETITTASGDVVPVEETWESVYPYGVFLFTDSQADVTEGGDAATVRVYRMGGTRGRATAWLSYVPALMPLDDETVSEGNAAGVLDIRIEAEDPLPVARYQPLGKDPDPEPGTLTVSEAPYTGEDAGDDDLVLTLSGDAESLQWQVLSDGRWKDVQDAAGEEFLVSREFTESYDFRCVYTLDGERFCTGSLHGEPYEKPEPEVLPERPADLDLQPEQSFSEVGSDPENPYDSLLFPLTFADGEWVKELRFTAPEDAEAEADKFGVLTILECEGGAVFETATVLTLSVTDNDEAEPFTVGFAEDSFTADRSGESARLELVRRGGGGLNLVSVSWTAEDGTALAGRDYASGSGEAVFVAGSDTAYIEIPLIDDGEQTDEPRKFTVRLGKVTGDGDGLCTLTDTEAEVVLEGSGTGSGGNLASMLHTSGATDVSGNVTWEDTVSAPVEDTVISGTPEEIPEEELLRGEIEGYDAAAPGDMELMTYQYGRISFSGKHGGNYWTDTASVAGSQKNDVIGWSDGSASGNGWQLSSDTEKRAWLSVANMPQKYSAFSGSYDFSAGVDNGWHLPAGYVYSWAGIARKNQSTYRSVDCEPEYSSSLFSHKVTYRTGGSLSASWGITEDVGYLVLGLNKVNAPSENNVYSRITRGTLTRRILANDLSLRIHTANDGEDGDGNTATAPEGAASMNRGSGVYESIKPEVTVVPGAGGVNSSGSLYVGSRLQVSLRNTDSYRPVESGALAAAVYLTRADGRVVSQVKPEKSGQDYYVNLVWDGMTADDLKDSYTVNVVMTRVQRLEMDLSPSVPRRLDEDGKPTMEIDTARVSEAWSAFRESGGGTITVGCSEATGNAPHFEGIREHTIALSDWKNGENPLTVLGSEENIQYINFNRSSADRIILNGRAYAGNERIWLTVEDLSYGTLSFKYYSAEYLLADSIMNTSVVRTELYLDGDANGRIDGSYNRDTGYFTLDSGSEDEFLMMMGEDEIYEEGMFAPIKLDNGKYAEYFLKVYYTMTPRSLDTESERKGAAQVLPAFTTSITDSAQYALLTEAQRSYRYLSPGRDSRGRYTSDDHTMFGPEASQVQYVDVPLGGDHSPVVHWGNDESGYMFGWEPDYHGNLIYPFQDPEPIYVEHSQAGDSYPLAEISIDRTRGTVQMDEQGKNNINGYLGSLVADTTVALCVTEQQYPVSGLMADRSTAQSLQPESSTLIRRSASPDPAYLSSMELPGMGTTSMDPSEGDQPYKEMEPDLGVNLDLLASAGNALGYVSVVTNKDEITIGFSLPLYSYGSTNGKKPSGARFPQTVSGPTSKYLNELRALDKALADPEHNSISEVFKSEGHDFKGLEGGGMSSTKVYASITFCASLTLKYDTVKNDFRVKEFGLGAVGGLSFRYTYRFAAFPLVYVYAAFNGEIGVTTGGTCIRTVKEQGTAVVPDGSGVFLEKGYSYEFKSKYTNINLDFRGKVYIEVFNSKGDEKPMTNSNSGYLQSSGGERITVRLGTDAGKEFISEKYIRITALEDSTILYLNRIEGIRNEVTWSGVKVAPKVAFEIGAGAGVDFMKVEACIKLVLSMGIVFGKPKDDGGRESVRITSASFAASIVARMTILCITEEIEAIGISVYYSEKDGWKWSWTHFGETEEQDFLTEGEESTLKLSPDTSGTQRIISPAGSSGDSLTAYDPDDPDVPFQLSGYNSSVNAFRLTEGMGLGNDFQVISSGGENYLLYTVARENPLSSAHSMMLVLSRIVATGGNAGLVNPVDENSEIPYIPVDVTRWGSQEDSGCGVLDFQARLDFDGETILVSWTSVDQNNIPADGLSPRELLQWTANKSRLKSAKFNPVSGATGFSAADHWGSGYLCNKFMYMGYSDKTYGDEITVYIHGRKIEKVERTERVKYYKDVLKGLGYDPDSEDEAVSSIGKYRLSVQEDIWDTRGADSGVTVFIPGSGTYAVNVGSEELVDNVAYGRLVDDDYNVRNIIAFTTKEQIVTDAEGNEAYLAKNYKNLLTIGRFYIISFKCNRSGKLIWDNDGTPVLLQTIYDYENNETLTDGIYTGGSIEPCSDPYFSNLKFLRATLDESIFNWGYYDFTEDFLLFEMNGCTYIIRRDSLLSFTGPEGKGTITPFFAPEEGQSATGRVETTIGADGAGGLAAVYVGTAEGSMSNALYLSKYDYVTESWSRGTMLAMNHMDVHEDAVREGWSQEEREQAFLGRREGYDRGGMDMFQFTNPQIALGVKEKERTGEESETAEDGDSAETTLLILTKGSMNYLKSPEGDDRFVTIDDEGTGPYPSGTGFYVISYGVGHQTLGEARLNFVSHDFSAGADLKCALSFKNTGDVSIRGSYDKDQAITVTLGVEGEDVPYIPLKSWNVTRNILPGQTVELNGAFTLPLTLPEGTNFNLTVSEGNYYEGSGGKPHTATLRGILTVGQKPELSIEQAGFSLDGLDSEFVTLAEDGSAVLDADILVANRGNADAEDVFVQFQYRTDTDEDGNPAYAPLDLTGSSLEVGEEEELPDLTAGQSGEDLRRGILRLGDIRTGYGRRVLGTFNVCPGTGFCLPGAVMELRLEVFSAADGAVITDGVLKSEHNEYNSVDNEYLQNVEAVTTFRAADHLLLAKGSVLRLPVRWASVCEPDSPDILVTELTDNETGVTETSDRFQRMDQNLDQAYYDAGSSAAGRGQGSLVLRAKEEGNGYIRIMDMRNNSYLDIAFTVIEASEGTDVFLNNGRLRFLAADGSEYERNSGNTDWSFASSVNTWGDENPPYEPYLKTLARAKTGAGFTFETVSEAITVALRGDALIESDFPGFEPVRVHGSGGSGSGEDDYAFVYFGTNPQNRAHNVTITVTQPYPDNGGYTDFDRIIEHYHEENRLSTGENGWDTPPKIDFLSSFPYRDGDSAEAPKMRLSVIGGRALNSVTVSGSGEILEIEKHTQIWWTVTVQLNGGGETVLRALDCNGNTAHVAMDLDDYTERMEALGISDASQTGDALNWMQVEVSDGDERYIEVSLAENAPAVDLETTVTYLGSDERNALTADMSDESSLLQGSSPSAGIRRFGYREDGMYAVRSRAVLSEGTDDAYSYRILRPDGTVAEEGNALDESLWNVEYVMTEDPEANCVSTMLSSAGSGSVTPSPSRARPGEKVTLTVTAERGYEVNRMNVIDGNGRTVPVTAHDDGTYTFIMPGTPVAVGPVFVRKAGSETCLKDETCPISSFTDAKPTAWYHDGVHWALDGGVMNGVGSGTFAPDKPTSRAMIVTMLYRLEGEPETAGRAGFRDVADGRFYTKAVDWAFRNGIVTGYNETTFGPDDNLTREQLVTILERYAKYNGVNVRDGEAADLSRFSDVRRISGWADKAFRWAVDAGIIQGMTDTTLNPKGNATRAQVATMLMRYDGLE